jgi:hypothetical protein
VWRAWLDHDDPSLQDHLVGCIACSQVVQELRANAVTASEAVRSVSPTRLPTAADTALARQRLAWRQQRGSLVQHAEEPVATPASSTTWLSRIPTGWRIAASGLAAALTLSILVGFTDGGRAAAAAFLSQFRSQQVAAVAVSPQSQAEIMRTLTALGNLGTVKTPSGATARPGNGLPKIGEPQPVTLAEAQHQLGFPIQTPDPKTLPAGLDPTPQVQVIPASELRFTFDKAKASSYYRSAGHGEVTLPDRFDGATLVVSTPTAVLLQYGSPNSHQALVIGQSGELVVSAEGKVSLEELRDFLLGLPGLPKETTDQLKQVKSWAQTLIVPIPTDKVNWRQERFKGADGLLLNDNTGVGSAAIWHANDHLYGVAGTLKANDLKRVAESLH